MDNPKMVAAGPLCFALYCAILVYCHRQETDGRIHPSRVKSLLDFSAIEIDEANPTGRPFGPSSATGDTGADPIQIADALVEAGLLESVDGWYVVHDYLKHNNSRAERQRIREAMRAGGRKGSSTRWAQRVGDGGSPNPPRSHTYRESDSPGDEVPQWGSDNPMDGVLLPKGEGRREKVENTPPSYSPRGKAKRADVVEDAVYELATGISEILGTTALAMSQTDLMTCQAALNQYAYLSARDLIDRAQAHQEYCRDHNLPLARTVAGFSDSWRRHNDHLADSGAPKVQRVQLGRTAGMTRIGELTKELLP